MTTREDLLNFAKEGANPEFWVGENNPVFELMLFHYPDKELLYPGGKHSGFPELGSTTMPGFYHDLDTAINVMHENRCDLRETVYDAGFIICRFPGLYRNPGPEGRMYFVWDEEKQGYFETEEPKIFCHSAY